MNNVNNTLYIPLYGKSYVSRRGILLRDPDAEAIWEAEGFALKGKASSKWLAYYMSMRAAVFDGWVSRMRQTYPEAVVLHLGCGMDSRAKRVGTGENLWFDVDFPEVIAERSRYFRESEHYRMVAADLRSEEWLNVIPRGGTGIVVMEGVSMYLTPEELNALLENLKGHFGELRLLMDCYSTFAAKASRFKNPINEVGVYRVYGLDDPESISCLSFRKEWDMTPETLISQLPQGDRRLFRKLYAGTFAGKLYRMYEFEGRCRT